MMAEIVDVFEPIQIFPAGDGDKAVAEFPQRPEGHLDVTLAQGVEEHLGIPNGPVALLSFTEDADAFYQSAFHQGMELGACASTADVQGAHELILVQGQAFGQ